MPKLLTVRIPENVASIIRSLHPELRRAVKAAIDAIAATPEAGEPLRGELEKYRKYRVRRYRLVYEVDRRARLIRILALGHRRDVYEDFAARLKNL